MVTMEQIQALSECIVEAFYPQQIILFGSYAYGKPTEDSDVDLLIIMPFEGHAMKKALEIRHHIQPPFAVDLLVRNPDYIKQRLSWNDFFLREIMTKGMVLHGSAYSGMGEES